ncbi:MAG: allophanate hydrolase subunit 1 [Sulfobacillus acidophilus]|uniref:Allophanate hydrolase subunit 1 n=1 Tax=Sulfobacillus acidophilus TaxID=53633 RepID=A0A2T2WLR2_9FIRM|nr:MAG: allophanate hydrolase subunit 1 [Sulfobacillus acidophilus]
MTASYKLMPVGDSGLMIDFGEAIDPVVNRAVHQMARAIKNANIPGIWGIVPAFSTLLVEFDPLEMTVDELQAIIPDLRLQPVTQKSRYFDIPVCYGGEYGEDLLDVAQRLGMSPQEVVQQHTAHPYQVYCIGFSPGFPLCGILPETLRLPRRTSPRTSVPAGSVAMAGSQTGIYPMSSPGGWHLLGRTPARLFCWDRNPPVRYEPGDFLRFRSIEPEEFARFEAQVAQGIDVMVEVSDA